MAEFKHVGKSKTGGDVYRKGNKYTIKPVGPGGETGWDVVNPKGQAIDFFGDKNDAQTRANEYNTGKRREL